MNRLLLALLVLWVLCGCNVSVSTTPEKLTVAQPGTARQQAEAFEAAKSVVHAMDRGAFDEVWEGASQTLKNMTFKVVFTKTLSATRGKLGQPAPRGAPRIGFASRIDPGMPEGEFSVVEVDTNFNGSVVTEKVVMAREQGQWKLVGYFMNTQIRLNNS